MEVSANVINGVNQELSRAHSELQAKREKLYGEIGEDPFINRLLRRFAQNVSKASQPAKNVTLKIQSYLDMIKNQQHDAFDVELKETGSRAEGANVSSNDDYDYLVVLRRMKVDTDTAAELGNNARETEFESGGDQMNLRAMLVVPQHFKTSELEKDAPKHLSYYQLFPSTAAPIATTRRQHQRAALRARTTSNPTTSIDDGQVTLDAKTFILAFKLWMESVILEGDKVVTNGPAISVWTTVAGASVKVDMTLAIEVKPGQATFLGSPAGNDSLNTEAKIAFDRCFSPRYSTGDKDEEQRTHYFIATGDVWRLSACKQERDFILACSETGKAVYKALKWINTEASITDQSEDSIMSSYPMKISLIHGEGNAAAYDNNEATAYSEKCRKILNTVDSDGNNLKSWFIKGDAVFKPGQKSYLEARRIAMYIRSIRRTYAGHGILQTILISIIFLAHVLISFLHGSLVFRDNSFLSIVPNFTLPMDEHARDIVQFGLYFCSITSVLTSSVGLVLALAMTYCIKKCSIFAPDFGKSEPHVAVVYGMHRWIIFYYLVFFLIGFVPLAFFSLWMDCFDMWPDKRLLGAAPVLEKRTEYCFSDHHYSDTISFYPKLLKFIAIASLSFSSLICLTLITHFIVTLIASRCRPSRRRWGWVFYGFFFWRDYPCRHSSLYPFCCGRCQSTRPRDAEQDSLDGVLSPGGDISPEGALSPDGALTADGDISIIHHVPGKVNVRDRSAMESSTYNDTTCHPGTSLSRV